MTDKKWNKIQMWIGIAILVLLLVGVGIWIISSIPKNLSYEDLVSNENRQASPVKIVAEYSSVQPPSKSYELEITDRSEIESIMSNVKRLTWKEGGPVVGGKALCWKLYFEDGEEVVISIGNEWFDGNNYVCEASEHSEFLYDYFEANSVQLN